LPGVVSPKKLYVKLEEVNVTPLGNVPKLLYTMVEVVAGLVVNFGTV